MDLYEIRGLLNAGKSIRELPLRVTYYARVSTEKDAQLHSLKAQMDYYADYIRRCPAWRYVEGYVDEGISGTAVERREGFLRMVADAGRGRFDFILTKEISRFSRSTLDSIRYTQQLLQCGVGVLFQSDGINTLAPDAELRLTILASIAQDEVRKTSERVRFGFRRAVEQGVVLGNSRIWGYEKEHGRLRVQEEEARMVRLIFQLYADERLGVRAVAERLTALGYRNRKGGGLSYSTVRGILTNPKYKGCYCGGKSAKVDYKLSVKKRLPREQWVVYEDPEAVPPIVSPQLWERANRLLAQRGGGQGASPPRTGGQTRYPYSGKLVCALHQLPCHRKLLRASGGAREAWMCRQYAQKGRKGCQAPILSTQELDRALTALLGELPVDWQGMRRQLLDHCAQALAHRRGQEELPRLRRERESLEERREKLLDLKLDGLLSDEEFLAASCRCGQALERCAADIARREAVPAGDGELLSRVERALDWPALLAEGYRYGVVDALVERIEIAPGGAGERARLRVQTPFLPQWEWTVPQREGASLRGGSYI